MEAFEWVAVGRLLLAVVLGGLVGLERQTHGRPAGLRTHILVCLGSALVVTVGLSLGPAADPGRAIAGIVTGVGFLGAGVIVKSKEIIRGLTTAACIWFVAAIGIAVGQGLYVIASASTFIGIAILTLMAWVAHRVPSVSYHCVHVRGSAQDAATIQAACKSVLIESRLRVTGMSAMLDKDGDAAELTLRLRTRAGVDVFPIASRLLSIDEVRHVVWE